VGPGHRVDAGGPSAAAGGGPGGAREDARGAPQCQRASARRGAPPARFLSLPLSFSFSLPIPLSLPLSFSFSLSISLSLTLTFTLTLTLSVTLTLTLTLSLPLSLPCLTHPPRAHAERGLRRAARHGHEAAARTHPGRHHCRVRRLRRHPSRAAVIQRRRRWGGVVARLESPLPRRAGAVHARGPERGAGAARVWWGLGTPASAQ